MKLLVAFILVFSFGVSVDAFAKGPKGDPVKVSPGGKPGDGSSGGGKVQSIDPATGRPRVDANGKPILIAPEEAIREGGHVLHGIGGSPSKGGSQTAPTVTRPLVNEIPSLITPKTGGVTAPQSMPPAFIPRKTSKRKASPEYHNRPFESVGKVNDELINGALERMKASEDDTELANLEIELTDAVRAQIEIATRQESKGKQADPEKLTQRVTDAADVIKKNRAKLIEAAKQAGLSENDPVVKNLLKNMIAVYSGIPFHSAKAGTGSAEAGIDSFIKNIGNLDGNRLLGMAKWFNEYGDAYRTARSGHPPMSIAEAHKEAAKARDRFVAERARLKNMDPEKLVGTLCKCNKCDG